MGSRHLGGYAMPLSAEEMLRGQQQKEDIPAYVRTSQTIPNTGVTWTTFSKMKNTFKDSSEEQPIYWAQ